MPLELLNEDYRLLTASDIFSLGAMIYEIAMAKRLPLEGKSIFFM